jgi:ADP-ribose pyrophosphatase YjhB (NUDIX family)
MNLFINDIPVRILKPGKKPDPGDINLALDAKSEPITKAKMMNHVWVKNATIEDLDVILDLVNSKVPITLRSLYVTVDNYELVKIYLKKKFRVIKAAGGLVRKKDKFLMIYRMKKWDLPKGKKENAENYQEAAIREVREECNVEVKLGQKICTTWHTYTMNKNSMLKKTRWYVMDLVDDAKSRPALEEDIEELRWMTQKEVYHALDNSYRSIHFVLEEYYNKVEKGLVKK